MNRRKVLLNLVVSATILVGCAAATDDGFAGATAAATVAPPQTAACPIPCTSSGAIDPVWLRQVEETLRWLFFGRLVRGPGWLGLGLPVR